MENEMENVMTPLSPTDVFEFSCSATVPCFNECCKDVNQFLTPYDVLRIRKRLGITSDVFLKEYTTDHIGPRSGIPVVTFKTNRDSEYKCPFTTPEGCRIYEDRPASCRMYPLARVTSRSKETGNMIEQYYLLREPHCKGFEQAKSWTIQEWITDQGLEPYNAWNDRIPELISLKKQVFPRPLNPTARHLMYLALYDADTFRTRLRQDDLPGACHPAPDMREQIQTDDIALLTFAIDWIKATIFKQ